jgi:acyl-CoA hydrolase
VRVESENVRSGERIHTSTAYLTMVAIDDDARPAAVPPIECETDDERRREREAQVRRENRLREREQLVGQRD